MKKQVEVIAHFAKGKIRVISVAKDKKAIKVLGCKRSARQKTDDKNLKYFTVESKSLGKFRIAFNAEKLEWFSV